MLKRAIYCFISILIQIAVVGIPVVKATDTGIIQPNRWETLKPSGKYGMESGVHYASSVNIEGSAEIEDVSACMEVVSDVLDALPRNHSESVENLSLIFDTDAKRGQGGGNTVKIRCAGISEEELAAVLIHEIGHTVDTGLIDSYEGDVSAFTDGLRAVYSGDLSVDFYEISWTGNGSFREETNGYSFVSEYAMTDPFEDFAESYLYYVLHGESFRRLALLNEQLDAKYAFLRDYVFEGVEYSGIDGYEAPLFDRPYDATRLPYELAELVW